MEKLRQPGCLPGCRRFRLHNGRRCLLLITYARRAMTCAYMPDGATFNGQKNVLPEEYLKTLNIGDILNNDQQNPLLWPAAKG